LKTKKKSTDLGQDISLDDAIQKLTEIKEGLPQNVANVRIESTINYGDGCFGSDDESSIFVMWTEYHIDDEKRCEGLAMCWARDYAFKMKHQPNGKDGKKAKELYDILISG